MPRQRLSCVRSALLATAGVALLTASCARQEPRSNTSALSPSTVSTDPTTAPDPATIAAQTPASDRELVRGTEDWTFAGRPGRTITTPSYRLFTTLDWPWMIEAMPAFMESTLRTYHTALADLRLPERPMDTYLMANRPQWIDLCRSILGPEDRSFEQIQRGGVTLNGRAMLYNVGPRDTFALVAHEGWHQYTQSVLRDPLPVWLEEGIAAYMEGHRWNRQQATADFLPWRNFERFEALRRASDRSTLMSLEELLNTTPQDELARGDQRALTYYAQAWALVHFLREGAEGSHARGLATLLEDASRGRLTPAIERALGTAAARSHALRRRGPQVFKTYISRDLSRASEDYLAFIAAVVRPGSARWIAEGRSPLASP
ncbi:MAG: DUF1570 domain-containing protein [Phycisphaeraceae bacterium]|nr:DUF1570 domain-containing protein [Phycisphaerae bacterium]MBX3391226.1 DUF1570 domain-containing protein [Phycisphaeraceae bacterium]HRJ50370.1 DUF1570 domain-containing protein [Phycisphaerales bacterium]